MLIRDHVKHCFSIRCFLKSRASFVLETLWRMGYIITCQKENYEREYYTFMKDKWSECKDIFEVLSYTCLDASSESESSLLAKYISTYKEFFSGFNCSQCT